MSTKLKLHRLKPDGISIAWCAVRLKLKPNRLKRDGIIGVLTRPRIWWFVHIKPTKRCHRHRPPLACNESLRHRRYQSFNLTKMLFAVCLKPHHYHRLGVRSSHQSPPVLKQDSRAVYVDHVVGLLELSGEPPHYLKLHLVGTINSYLRRVKHPRHARKLT